MIEFLNSNSQKWDLVPTQPLHLPGQLHVLKSQSSSLACVQWLHMLRHLQCNGWKHNILIESKVCVGANFTVVWTSSSPSPSSSGSHIYKARKKAKQLWGGWKGITMEDLSEWGFPKKKYQPELQSWICKEAQCILISLHLYTASCSESPTGHTAQFARLLPGRKRAPEKQPVQGHHLQGLVSGKSALVWTSAPAQVIVRSR